MNLLWSAYIFLSVLIIAVDQITKQLAINFFTQPYVVTPFLSFELAYNHGISWGIGNSGNPLFTYAATGMTLIVTACLFVYMLTRIISGKPAILETVVFSGAVSNNVLDRFFRGGVVDFIHFFYNTYSFPLFNIADICIVVGIVLLLVYRMNDVE